MSSYIVTHNHINYLINAALIMADSYQQFHYHYKSAGLWASKELTPETATEVGRMLLAENVRGVAGRYAGSDHLPKDGENEPQPYEYQWNAYGGFDRVQVLKSISCLDYQSCDVDTWPDSEAFAFLQALTTTAISSLPGYDEAEWGAPAATPHLVRLGG